MVDMQLLLSGLWRFHGNDGRECVGRRRRLAGEHAVLHNTASPDDPNANSLVEETVGARQRGIDVSCFNQTHNARLVPGQNHVLEPIVFERRTLSGQAECASFQRETPSSWQPWRCLAFAIKLELAQKKIGSNCLARNLWSVGTGVFLTTSNIATFRNDGEVEEVFTSAIVRSRDM